MAIKQASLMLWLAPGTVGLQVQGASRALAVRAKTAAVDAVRKYVGTQSPETVDLGKMQSIAQSTAVKVLSDAGFHVHVGVREARPLAPPMPRGKKTARGARPVATIRVYHGSDGPEKVDGLDVAGVPAKAIFHLRHLVGQKHGTSRMKSQPVRQVLAAVGRIVGDALKKAGWSVRRTVSRRLLDPHQGIIRIHTRPPVVIRRLADGIRITGRKLGKRDLANVIRHARIVAGILMEDRHGAGIRATGNSVRIQAGSTKQGKRVVEALVMDAAKMLGKYGYRVDYQDGSRST
jgi:hypothetical protein